MGETWGLKNTGEDGIKGTLDSGNKQGVSWAVVQNPGWLGYIGDEILPNYIQEGAP